MVNLGQIAIVAAFMVTIYVVIVGFTGGISRERNVVSSAIWGFYSVPILLLIAMFMPALMKPIPDVFDGEDSSPIQHN